MISKKKAKSTLGCYLAKNPCLYLYLKALDAFFCLIKIFRKNLVVKAVPEKILIVQLAHKGDVMITTSVIPLIKEAYPAAIIGMLIGSWSQDVLYQHPLIDIFHVFDHPKLDRSCKCWMRKIWRWWKDVKRMIRELKAHRYDLAIDVYCYYPNSHFLTWLAKIPRRIGHQSGGGAPLLTDCVFWFDQRKHISLYHLDLLQPLEIFLKEKQWLKTCLPRPSQNQFNVLEMQYQIKKPYLIFHPYSGNPLKNWKDGSWRKLAQLFEHFSYKILFTGGSQIERENIEKMIPNLNHALNLAGRLSFEELKALVCASSAVVSVDTMIGHLAAAYDIPSITLYVGPSDPLRWKPASCKNIFFCSEDGISLEEVAQEIKKIIRRENV